MGLSEEPEEGLQQSSGAGNAWHCLQALRLHIPRAEATTAKLGNVPDQAEGSMGVKEIQHNHREGSDLGQFSFYFILIKIHHLPLPSPPMSYPPPLTLCKFMEEQYLLRYFTKS